jgi:hypothetical protein
MAYSFLVLYTYTHLVFDNHLVMLRAQSKFILPCSLLEEGQEHTVPREFVINPRETFVGKIKLPYAQHSTLRVLT